MRTRGGSLRNGFSSCLLGVQKGNLLSCLGFGGHCKSLLGLGEVEDQEVGFSIVGVDANR